MALINFQEDWVTPTVYTVLHASVKIQVPEGSALAHLRGAQLSVSSGANYEAFRSSFVPFGTFADGGWQDILATLEPLEPPPQLGAFIPAAVRQLGIQVITSLEAPPGGPAAPLPTTVFVDDLWLERE